MRHFDKVLAFGCTAAGAIVLVVALGGLVVWIDAALPCDCPCRAEPAASVGRFEVYDPPIQRREPQSGRKVR